MGVLLMVAVLVVTPMDGYPSDEWSLDGHGSEYGQDGAYGCVGLKSAVGEQAVVTDGDAESCCQVHDEEHCDFGPIDADFPEPDQAIDECSEWEQDGDQCANSLQQIGGSLQ
jgi:hypothetical protein